MSDNIKRTCERCDSLFLIPLQLCGQAGEWLCSSCLDAEHREFEEWHERIKRTQQLEAKRAELLSVAVSGSQKRRINRDFDQLLTD